MHCLCDCLQQVGANRCTLHRRKKQHTAAMEEDQLRRSGNAELWRNWSIHWRHSENLRRDTFHWRNCELSFLKIVCTRCRAADTWSMQWACDSRIAVHLCPAALNPIANRFIGIACNFSSQDSGTSRWNSCWIIFNPKRISLSTCSAYRNCISQTYPTSPCRLSSTS